METVSEPPPREDQGRWPAAVTPGSHLRGVSTQRYPRAGAIQCSPETTPATATATAIA